MNDRLLPLLGIGESLHPELDGMFLSNPDQSDALPVSEQSLKTDRMARDQSEALGRFLDMVVTYDRKGDGATDDESQVKGAC